MQKKPVIGLIVFVLIASVMTVGVSNVNAAGSEPPLLLGVADTPGKIDPTDAYDSVSIDTINQICEGLYRANYSSPDMEPIPQLAATMGTWNLEKTELTIPLREDVLFHDGTPMNATHVKWNFDRLFDFVLNKTGVTNTPRVLFFNDEGDAIVNETVVVNEFTIKFVLNKAWTVWEDILAFSATFIVKPNETYKNTFFTVADYADMIGTGPFKLTALIPDTKTVFIGNDDYYLGAPDIQNMEFLVIADGDARSEALLYHQTIFGSVGAGYLDQAEADEDLTIVRAKNTVAYYLQFNVEQIPRDLRYAIAHSLNYSYYTEEIAGGEAFELHTPIPEGMPYHNASIEGLPYFNVTKAREILLESSEVSIISALAAAGLDSDSTDAEWRAVANSATPLYDLNFTRYQSTFVGYIEAWVEDNVKALGIKLQDDVIGDWGVWSEWVTEPGNKDKVLFSLGGWAPDYNNPINMMEPIFKTGAEYNEMNLANATLDALMAAVYSATPSEQADIFHALQEMIAVDIVPCTYFEQGMTTLVYNNKALSNVDDNLNVFGLLYMYNVVYSPVPYIGPLETPVFITTSQTIATANFRVEWSPVTDAVNYELYANETLISTTTTPYCDLTFTMIGTYYIRVIALNGTRLSLAADPIIIILENIPLEQPEILTPNQTITTANIRVEWTPVTDATYYTLFVNGFLISTTSESYSDLSFLVLGTYHISVIAHDSTQSSSESNEITIIVEDQPLDKPVFITPNQTITTTTIRVEWDSVTDALEYDVYVNGIMINTTSETYYDLSFPVLGVYRITVIARDSARTSPASDDIQIIVAEPSASNKIPGYSSGLLLGIVLVTLFISPWVRRRKDWLE